MKYILINTNTNKPVTDEMINGYENEVDTTKEEISRINARLKKGHWALRYIEYEEPMLEFEVSYEQSITSSFTGMVKAKSLEEAIEKVRTQGADALDDTVEEGDQINSNSPENFAITGEWKPDARFSGHCTLQRFEKPIEVNVDPNYDPALEFNSKVAPGKVFRVTNSDGDNSEREMTSLQVLNEFPIDTQEDLMDDPNQWPDLGEFIRNCDLNAEFHNETYTFKRIQ